MRKPALIRSVVAWTVGILATVGLALPGVVIALVPGLKTVMFEAARL